MDNQIIAQLQGLNLSLNEAKVYEALLKIGQTSAGEIIRKTGLHRSVVYETLDKLIDRKLVFKIEKKNIAHFQPTDPQRILQNIKTQEEVALDLIPKLKDMINTKLPEITVYEGVEAYRRFWINSVKRLPEGATDYGAGSIGQRWWDYMGKDAQTYFKISVKKKIKWKLIIFTKTPSDVELLKKYPTLHEQRIIEKGAASEGNFNVLGEESVVLHSATEPLIIEIKNPTLVRVFENIFRILWEKGKIV
jgi:sugar-specific transcriptional regulator TrmB